MALEIVTFALGPLQTNCFVLRSGEACWVVDPGMMPEPLLAYLRAEDVRPQRILLTHGHADHIGGAGGVKAAYDDALVCCPGNDADMLSDPDRNMSGSFGLSVTAPAVDELIEPGQMLHFGDMAWRVLDTSGHTPGGVSYYCRLQDIVITGDALFAGSIGRTDIPGADEGKLIANIRKHLLVLPEDTRVLPGHGPPTTIGAERATNPYVGS